MPKHTAAVIGLGVGEQHARLYDRDANCTLKSVYDLDKDRCDKLAATLGVQAASSEDEIFSDNDIDVVSIASYDDAHFNQVIKALGAGKNIFVEKPLCRTLDELRSIKSAWEAAQKPMIGSNLVLRAAPLYVWLRDEIANGTFGDIYAIDGDYLYGRLHKITEGWRKDVVDYSPMSGGGVHMIDLMCWLTGQYPDNVASIGNNIATRETAFRYNDFIASTFRFPSGLIGRITANYACVHRHHHILRIFGTKATFIYDDQGPRIMTTRDEDARARMLDIATLPDGKGVLIPGFLQALASPTGREESVEHEFRLIAATATADLSLKNQQTETISYV